MVAYVLDASLDAPATELSLAKLRLRRAPLRFTQQDQFTSAKRRWKSFEHRRNAKENLGGLGAGPQEAGKRNRKIMIFDLRLLDYQ